MLDTLTSVARIAGEITGIIALFILVVKPIREKILGASEIREGQKALLRDRMSSTYYKHLDDKRMRQYEYENFMSLYKSYKAMGGNSFIDHIKLEVDEWEVVS